MNAHATASDARRTVHCFGDSHVWVFDVVDRRGDLLPATRFVVHGVGGATAFGLANPNSKTNALPIFTREIRSLPQTSPLLFMLGEVDCGFLVWLRALQRGTDVEDELQTSLDRYVEFLDRVVREGHRDLTVVSVPPPTVADYGTWEGLDNARSLVRATLEERTAATRWYSGQLARRAAQHGWRFLDLDPALLDPSTGLVRASLRNPDPLDHHYDRDAYAELVGDRLEAAGYA